MDELLLEPDSSRPCISVVKVEPGLSSNYDSEFASETLEYEELKVNLGEFQNLQEFSVKTELGNSDEENCTSDTKDNKLFTFENEDFQQMNVNEQYGLSVKEEELDISEEFESKDANAIWTQSSNYEVQNPEDDDEESETLDCDMCDFTADDKTSLTTHKIIIHVKNSLIGRHQKVSCELCAYKGLRKGLKQHLKRFHKALLCRWSPCLFYAFKYSKMAEHLATSHVPKRNQCKLCDYACCSSPDNLKEHVWEKHDRFKPYKCEECWFGTVRIDCFRRHLRMKHWKFVCMGRKCLFSTNDESEMDDHMLSEHVDKSATNVKKEKDFRCDSCPAVFGSLSRRNMHKKTMHSWKKYDPWGHNPYKEDYLKKMQKNV